MEADRLAPNPGVYEAQMVAEAAAGSPWAREAARLRRELEAAQAENTRLTDEWEYARGIAAVAMRERDRLIADIAELRESLGEAMNDRFRNGPFREERDRLASQVADLTEGIEAEIQRCYPEAPDCFPALWNEWRRKAWLEGVRATRSVVWENLSNLLARLSPTEDPTNDD